MQARNWAQQALDLTDAGFAPASADASFRRYFRLLADDGASSWIVMDAPPGLENSAPFVRIAGLLQAAGLHVPTVLQADLQRGFLLLTDLGRQTYLGVLNADNADALFGDALRALVQMQRAAPSDNLPAYDRALLLRELELFAQWFVQRHLQRQWTSAQAQDWQQVCEVLVESALAQPQVFVHRDYMPRNLMHSSPNPGVLDFQDAVRGPVTYDAVCLFKDAFLSWPEARVHGWLNDYRRLAQTAGIPLPQDFRRAADWMGLHRHLKVLGIFARICHRDGKPHYLQDAPRFVRYVGAVAAQYAEMAPLQRLFDQLGLGA
ncbi:aminoglycoside phosphotransferase family protein [Panacagrimonas sp.]|uniref:aminoglycoside phosphotransferase family protein n=1 Tax=Panacagrimonas sp. TaxID=2480088 RepID=UPI003B521006